MIARLAAFSLLLLVAAAPHASAQAAPPADPIRELLVEVRGLRAAIERAATVGARIQLLVARVQIQEGRLAELNRRGDSVRAEVRQIEQEQGAAEMEAKVLSERDPGMSAEQREGIAALVKQMTANNDRLEKRKQELVIEENMVTQQISVEQGRWNEINGQLDQLERSLTAVKQ